jgi:alkylation response protein AidB-like acyl-CoA dehydrogenase/flavin-dependent dehydrogenase/electron transfer flavoprotein alpha subunit/ferredoxin-like protein FixX
MAGSNYDVVVVGGGAAGMTAAIALARSGFAVAVVEAAAFPGAENWSGCVYFCENLAHPEVLGQGGVEALAWERRLVERGFFASDGYSLLGMKYRDPEAFRHCYTVLRPIFDHHLAQVAIGHGVALLCDTTAESLIRERGRVIGVATQRGPLYADLVFLAEGDASHLVTREGYERSTDPREQPRFLQGIKEVLSLPPGAIEEAFGVGADEGVAYEILLRNGTFRGKPVQLNMGGFVYTNRQGLSVGLVLPADNLREHFEGDPNLLLEWFEHLPALRPWLKGSKREVFGAKIIRGGGARDIPHLIDEGLAIGGAASAIGVDFPYPNFTGPATAMGLLLAQAARRIRDAGGDFTRDALERHYLTPLRRTHYWRDVEFLRRWPGYVKRTTFFFGPDLDLALGTAYVWTRPGRWALTKWFNWLRLFREVAAPGVWRQMRTDLRHLARALRFREVASRPALGRLLLDGTINALRDLAHSPRANVPSAGKLRLYYAVDGEAEPTGLPPRLSRRWFGRVAPVFAAAARRVYANDDTPLADKLPGATALLVRQINILDLMVTAGLALAAGVTSVGLAAWDRLGRLFRRSGTPRGLYPRYAAAAARAGELATVAPEAGANWDDRLAALAYETARTSHIHVLWPRDLAKKSAVVQRGLWHVCPARVYEARVSSLGQLQVVVNHENCIKCETCWRTSDLVDWGRDGRHRFIYAVGSPVVGRLLDAVVAAGTARPALPRVVDHWEAPVGEVAALLEADPPQPANGQGDADLVELRLLLTKLDGKLAEFDAALAHEPRTVDRARSEYLEILARYAQQLALRIVEVLRGSPWATIPHAGVVGAHWRLTELAAALLARAEERARRTWDQRFAWAAADGRHLRQHHLEGMRRYLDLLARHGGPAGPEADPARTWLRAEEDRASTAEQLAVWRARLDEVFGPTAWRDLDRGTALSSAQDATLRDLINQVPRLDSSAPARALHPPERKALLAELGRRDPSLAYRVAGHLWARDLARLRAVSPALAKAAARWERGDEWACFAVLDGASGAAGLTGEALLAPAVGARTLLLLLGDQLVLAPAGTPGLVVEPLATLGLRGAGLARVRLEGFVPPEAPVVADADRVQRVWEVLSAADLASIASGMAEQLCRRAVAQATSRVQFPGLFHDEEARDPIGKFGAIKKMVAQMAARRYLIETLDHCLSPADFSAASVERGGLVLALVAEALGTAPGSLSYNAGQVYGGTGYSEDDLLAKFYRDAAAWRFLGAGAGDAYRRHGEQLLRSWHADGRRLASVPHEAELFDQVAERKALQGELDEVRVLRSRLRGLVNEWQNTRRSRGSSSSPAGAAEVAELLAREDAHLLAEKILVLRTHARLEYHHDAELDMALLRVWLGEAGLALEEFERVVRQHQGADAPPPDRPLVDPAVGGTVPTYADFLAVDAPYETGDFLVLPVDPAQPRYVPEMVQADPDLAARDREYRETLAAQFGGLRADGLPFERHIERVHRPDPEDLDFCRRHGFFRLQIPAELGGEGRRKVDYYLFITNAQREADFGISLTIQVNSSLGTTPILLARDKDLPKALKDLDAFAKDQALQDDVRSRLRKLAARARTGRGTRWEHACRLLRERLQKGVMGRPALRVLAFRFLQTWDEILRAPDPTALDKVIPEALARWEEVCSRAAEFRTELGLRREACALFLRWIASGQISGFALTEPTAGSDTARVATRARLRSVPVEPAADGLFHFVPAGGKEPRTLLDAAKLEFREGTPFYRLSETTEPAPLRFDAYDYETDNPESLRYLEHEGRRIPFTDVGRLRERDGRLWYDYWELTGAKMWITNGRMAGVLCLYAKTDEGVTGFLVDRHAEGLVVGKDEAKMGQLGSPTNELTLQSVRVPRENVLGLEGRGQVNALETLNVGRAGLAMTAMAQMAGLIDGSRTFAEKTYGDLPDWALWRLERMEEDRFTAEALAHDVIGRFEHPKTKSVRLESAAAKMLVSELLHRVIETAEEIHGPAGQTQAYLVEKRKRDARVLNIYEGTNEIQRFLILKELAGDVAPRWSRSAAPRPGYLGPEALQLEAQKAEFRQRLVAALEVFGQELWQNPNLQANCFLLAEAAAWLKAADSTFGRLAWLDRQAQADENTVPSARFEVGRRALARCAAEVRQRLRRFDEELAHLRRGYYAPEVRAASLLFDRLPDPAPDQQPASRITRPLAILVLVEPTAAGVPKPQVADGRLLEAHVTLRDADRAALETALRLRDQAEAPVTIDVAAVGTRAFVRPLREVQGLGVDRVLLVAADSEGLAPDSAAAALAAVLGEGKHFDLILVGSGGSDTQEGLIARLTALALGAQYVGSADQLAVRRTEGEDDLLLADADGGSARVRALPAAVGLEAGLALRPFRTQDYLAGLAKAIEIERWPRKVLPRTVRFGVAESVAASPTEQPPRALTPDEAAAEARARLGLAELPATAARYDGVLDDVAQPTVAADGVLAVIAADGQGLLQPTAALVLHAAQTIAASEGTSLTVLLLAGTDEASQRRALGEIVPSCGDVLVVGLERGEAAVNALLLRECWPGLALRPRVVVGEPWCEDAFAALGTRPDSGGPTLLRVRALRDQDGTLLAESATARGTLHVLQEIDTELGKPWWISLAAEAQVAGTAPMPHAEEVHVQRWQPRTERFFGRADIERLLHEVKAQAGLVRLADAEFIIDVGYGVGSRDGYEAVIEPLEQALRALGVRGLVIGGSRKVTEELHLLPADRQIGQSGVSVNPQLLLAIGVSGAPQHLSYIGSRAVILAFNRDREAPLMTLGQRQARPRVFPVVGDLFETVPAFTRALAQETPHPTDAALAPA